MANYILINRITVSYSERQLKHHSVSWNRLILLYGTPGTCLENVKVRSLTIGQELGRQRCAGLWPSNFQSVLAGNIHYLNWSRLMPTLSSVDILAKVVK